MATYASYKTLTADNFQDNSITAAKLGAGAGNKYCVFWVYNERGMKCMACSDAGDCCEQALQKQYLKFGQVEAVAQALLAVTTVHTLQADQVVTMV